MSFGATKLLAASGGEDAYSIDQSIMLDQGDDAYLHFTPSSSGSRTTFTYSVWMKSCGLGSDGYLPIFGYKAGSESGYYQNDFFITGNTLRWFGNLTGSSSLITNRVFRDQSSWYHIVFAVDTTQSTAANRMKFYVNGSQITSFSTETYPAEDEALYIGMASKALEIGRLQAAYTANAYFAEAYFIENSQLTPSSFGETDSVTGQWIPIEYTGSYGGNNSFYLKFVSGAIGTDSSGEGNNFTAVNLGNGDVLLDTPTNNFPIVNALEPYNTTISTFRQGNLNIKASAYSSGNYGNNFSSFILPTSGKWYVEMLTGVQAGSGNVAQLGITKQGPEGIVIPNQAQLAVTFSSTTGLAFDTYANTADLYDGGSSVDQDTGLTATSYVTALAVDIDNDKVWVGYDGGSSITWLNSGNPATGANGAAHTFDSDSGIYMAVATSSDNANRSYIIMNFGQNGTFSNYKTAGGNADGAGIGNFFYSPPSGFKALCTKNLPTPTIKLPGSHFNPVIYTGSDNDAVSQSVTGVGFEPDLVIIKKRNATASPAWWDQVRGEHKGLNYI